MARAVGLERVLIPMRRRQARVARAMLMAFSLGIAIGFVVGAIVEILR